MKKRNEEMMGLLCFTPEGGISFEMVPKAEVDATLNHIRTELEKEYIKRLKKREEEPQPQKAEENL